MEEIYKALRVPRGSLSPSVVPEVVFEEFQGKVATESETSVMSSVAPLITGNADIYNGTNTVFTNMAPITGSFTIKLRPDFFDGAYPEAAFLAIREDLDTIIVPSKARVPTAPNFFLEAKGTEAFRR